MNILVVDDNQLFLMVAKKWLDNGNNTDIAMDGFEALSMLQKKKYDCAIIDLFMPEMSGLKLYAYIIRKYKIPVIIMSNQIDDNALQSLKHLDFRALKPTTKKEFLLVLNRALAAFNEIKS